MGSDGTVYPPAVDGIVNKSDPNYVPAKRRVLPKVMLNEPSHELHNMVVGNETHFWTEVHCDDGKTYCFDNNHPGGVEKSDFYASLDFALERYRPEDGTRDQSKQIYYGDDAHHFMSRDDIVERGQVVIAPLSVLQQRDLAENISDWKPFPDKLKGAQSISQDLLRPAQVQGHQQGPVSADSQQAMRERMQQMRTAQTDPEPEVEASNEATHSLS